MSLPEKKDDARYQQIAQLIALFESGCTAEAQYEAKRLIEIWPQDAECWRNYAFIVTRNGDDQTKQVLQQALIFNPDDVHLLRQLSRELVGQGNLKDAEIYLARAVNVAHQSPEILFEYASLQFQLQNFEKALASFLQLIRISPRVLDAYRGAINCQLKLRNRDAALEICLSGIEQMPDCAPLYLQRADLLMQQIEFAAAIIDYKRAIAFGEKSETCYLNLGVALKNCGEFSESLVFLKLATDGLLNYLSLHSQGLDRTRRIPTQKNLESHWAKLVLQSLKGRFAKHQIDWCLMAGTLLGIYRDGGFIRGDKDIDIAMPFEIDRGILVDILCQDGEFVVQSYYAKKWQQHAKYSLTIKHRASDICVDIFFLEPVSETCFLMGIDHPGQAILSQLSRFDFAYFAWQDEMWPVPGNVERYLLETYGNSWREPNPFYDTIISHPCRIASSIPVVLCYGYAHLYACLSNQKWKHALAYAEQLLQRREDELLNKIAAQCRAWDE